MGAAVAEYRANIISPSGELVRSVVLLCPDDETALEYAKNLVDGHDVELWDRHRRIGTIKRSDRDN